MPRVAFVGHGFVGKAAENAFRGVDKAIIDPTLGTDAKDLWDFDPNFVFVAVPTPMTEMGTTDGSIILSVMGEIAGCRSQPIAVIKSTCPPTLIREILQVYPRIVVNPEFLTEANANHDFIHAPMLVLGGEENLVDSVQVLYDQFTVCRPCPVIKTNEFTASMIKYLINSYLATKISFANEMYQICSGLTEQGMGVDYDSLIRHATIDPRLGASYWRVPSRELGPRGEALFGFGLSCFPKDLCGMIALAESLNVVPYVTSGAWTKNLEVRPEKDWEQLKGRAVSTKEAA